jgi:hypothetical protein
VIPKPINAARIVRIADVEKETLDGLRRAGFELDFGIDGAGISRAYFTRGGIQWREQQHPLAESRHSLEAARDSQTH